MQITVDELWKELVNWNIHHWSALLFSWYTVSSHFCHSSSSLVQRIPCKESRLTKQKKSTLGLYWQCSNTVCSGYVMALTHMGWPWTQGGPGEWAALQSLMLSDSQRARYSHLPPRKRKPITYLAYTRWLKNRMHTINILYFVISKQLQT